MGTKRGVLDADLFSNALESEGLPRTMRPTPSASASLRSEGIMPMRSEGAALLLMLLGARHDGEKPRASPAMASAAMDAAATAGGGASSASHRHALLSLTKALITSDHGLYVICGWSNPQSTNRCASFTQSATLTDDHSVPPYIKNHHRQKRGKPGQVIVTLCWCLVSAAGSVRVSSSSERSAEG